MLNSIPNVIDIFGSTAKSMITSKTNSVITGIIGRTIPMDGRSFLGAVGVKLPKVGPQNPLASSIINNGLQSAIHIVGAIGSGLLNQHNTNMVTDYETNKINSYQNTPLGVLSGHVNAISDMQAALFNNPLVGTDIFDSPQIQSVINSSDVTNMEYNLGGVNSTYDSYWGKNATRLGRPEIYSSFAPNYSATKKANVSDQVIDRIGTITSESAYTDALIDYQPKFKYTYVVEFQFYQEYQQDIPAGFTFLIKRFDKPEISIEHEEVNFYNVRIAVPKKTIYNPVTLEIHDDIKNEAMNFLVSYLRRISPVFNQETSQILEENGLDFTSSTGSYNLYTTQNNINIIEHIKIYHVYNASRTMDVHTFNNPKIQKVNFADFDMSDGTNTCGINLEFVYDNYFLDTGIIPDLSKPVLGISQLGASSDPQALTSTGAIANRTKYTNLLKNSKDPSSIKEDPASSIEGSDPTNPNAAGGSSNANGVPYTAETKIANQIDGSLNTNILNNGALDAIENNAAIMDKPIARINLIDDINALTKTPIKLPYSETATALTNNPSNAITPNFESYIF